MATFFVGQRVRVVRVERYQHLLGAEARVTKLDVIGIRLDGSLIEGCVQLDIPAPGYLGKFVAPPPDWIEPILPDGHRAGDYSLSELLDRCRAGEGVPA